MKRKFQISIFLLFNLFNGFVSLNAHGKALLAEKGPILHFHDGHLKVRMQAKKLKGPIVEWRQNGEIKKYPMHKEKILYWEATLNNLYGEYRIVEGKQETPWYPILNQDGERKNFTFAVYGESLAGYGLGSGSGLIHKAITHQIKSEAPCLVLHTGNLVSLGNNPNHWEIFFREGNGLFQTVPFQPAIGIRDLSKTGRFTDNVDVPNFEWTYYHFKYGPAHFIALDTTQDHSPESKQFKFLEKTLKKIKGESPVFVYLNHPPFSGSKKGGDENVYKHMVPLFEEYGVDIVFSGQDCSYQRIGPINGVTYVVTGGGGAPLTSVTRHPAIKDFHALYHYVLVEVDGDELKIKMKDPRGLVRDAFEIKHLANPIPPTEITKRPELPRSQAHTYK